MNLYAETSAVVAWLLDEPTAESVRAPLAEAEVVIASDLTVAECERVLVRAAATAILEPARATLLRRRLIEASLKWYLLRLEDEVMDRVRRPFPHEPIRTLDALHLSSCLVARTAVPDLTVLSLDQRVRSNARELGFEILPT